MKSVFAPLGFEPALIIRALYNQLIPRCSSQPATKSRNSIPAIFLTVDMDVGRSFTRATNAYSPPYHYRHRRHRAARLTFSLIMYGEQMAFDWNLKEEKVADGPDPPPRPTIASLATLIFQSARFARDVYVRVSSSENRRRENSLKCWGIVVVGGKRSRDKSQSTLSRKSIGFIVSSVGFFRIWRHQRCFHLHV